MKHFNLLFFAVLCLKFSSIKAQTWSPQFAGNVASNQYFGSLNEVHAVDANNVFACGDSGAIFTTNNEGRNSI